MSAVILKAGDSRLYDLPIGTKITRRNTSPRKWWDGQNSEKVGPATWKGGGTVSPFPSGDLEIDNPQEVIELLLDALSAEKRNTQREQIIAVNARGKIDDILSFVSGDVAWIREEDAPA